MDSACWIQEDQAVNCAVMIVLACSDARLRLLLWESEKLTLQDEAVAGEHCLLQVDFCLSHVKYIPIAGGKVRRHINSGDREHRRGSDGLGSSQRSAAHVFGKAEDPPVGSELSSG